MPLSYASTSDVKRAMAITDTTDDVLIARYVNEGNSWLEGRIGYPVGPSATSTTRFFDASSVSRDGRWLMVPMGVRSVNSIHCADSTGAAYKAVPSSDYFLRPVEHERLTGWPALTIEMTDSPSSGTGVWGSTTFPTRGYRVVQVHGSWGFDAIPDDLAELATRLSVAAFRSRAYGTGDSYAAGPDGERVFEREMSARDWATVRFYRANLSAGVVA